MSKPESFVYRGASLFREDFPKIFDAIDEISMAVDGGPVGAVISQRGMEKLSRAEEALGGKPATFLTCREDSL